MNKRDCDDFNISKKIYADVDNETHGLTWLIKTKKKKTLKDLVDDQIMYLIDQEARVLNVVENPHEIFDEEKNRMMFLNGTKNIVRKFTKDRYSVQGIGLTKVNSGRYRLFIGAFVEDESDKETFKRNGKKITIRINDYLTNFFQEGDVPMVGVVPIYPSVSVETGDVSLGYTPAIQRDVRYEGNDLIFIISNSDDSGRINLA